MLRVLFVTRDLVFHGGIPKAVLYFCSNCDPHRAHAEVATCIAPEPDMVDAFGKMGINPTTLGDKGYVGAMRNLRRLLKRDQFDAVVACNLKPYIVAKLASRSKVPVVLWIHSIPLIIDTPAKKMIFRMLSRRDPLIFASHAVESAHKPKNHKGFSRVVYYGVRDPYGAPELEPYSRDDRQKFGISENATVLGYIAEFTGWKDHPTLLRAFDLLDSSVPDPHLLLIGTGASIQQCREIAARSRHPERIHFLGPRRDARKLLGLIDIYVHPSRGEALGLAVVEAMLAERPVIVAREAAFVEYAEDQKTGLFFEPGNEVDLAAKIASVARDPMHARSLGQEARRHCLQMFAPSKFVNDLLAAIQDSIR